MNILSWSSTLVLGMLHALEPGHGKTYLAAVVMGKSWKWKQMLLMMGSLISSHFLVLLVLALGIRYVFDGLQDEQLLERISGFMPCFIIAFGTYLMWKYYQLRKKEASASTCSCCSHGPKDKASNPQNSVMAGLIGGLIPCPTGFAPLLLAGLDEHFSHTVTYLLAYLLGMGIVLGVLTLCLSMARPLFANRLKLFTPKVHPQLLSALLILITGVCYLFVNFFVHPHSHPHP